VSAIGVKNNSIGMIKNQIPVYVSWRGNYRPVSYLEASQSRKLTIFFFGSGLSLSVQSGSSQCECRVKYHKAIKAYF